MRAKKIFESLTQIGSSSNRELFTARRPESVTTISFLDKAGAHPSEYKTDLCGFEIANEFVVGYGLDYANYYRNLPYIGVLRPECYQ